MSVLVLYRKFRDDLRGWVKITFDEFRTHYEPLLRRKAWAEGDQKRVADFATLGGAFALRNLYARGATKPLIAKLLGEQGKEAEFQTRDELDTQMRYLIANCLRDDWNPQTFTSFGAYLDSDKGPDDLAKIKNASASSMFQSGTTEPLPAESKTAAPTRDLFAEKYRAACPAFKEAVQTHLAEGAKRAALRKQAAVVSAIGGITSTGIEPPEDPIPELVASFGAAGPLA